MNNLIAKTQAPNESQPSVSSLVIKEVIKDWLTGSLIGADSFSFSFWDDLSWILDWFLAGHFHKCFFSVLHECLRLIFLRQQPILLSYTLHNKGLSSGTIIWDFLHQNFLYQIFLYQIFLYQISKNISKFFHLPSPSKTCALPFDFALERDPKNIFYYQRDVVSYTDQVLNFFMTW